MSRRWTYQAGGYGDRVSVYEVRDGSGTTIYCRLRDKGTGKYIRRSMRHEDRQKAIAWADKAAKQLEEGGTKQPNGPPTWSKLFALYRQYATPNKTPLGQKEDERRIEMWTRLLGGSHNPSELTFGILETFIRDRRQGLIDCRGNRSAKAKGVRTRSVEADLQFLKIVLNWGTQWRIGGEYLLSENPMRGFKIPTEQNPRRPVISHDRYLSLLEVADQLRMEVIWDGKHEKRPTYLSEPLVLGDGIGRRISAICTLHSSDIQLDLGEYGAIVFPARSDKKRRESTVYLTPGLREVIDRALERIEGKGFLFPAPRDWSQPIRRELVAKWLREAEVLAKLPKQDGTGIHGLRRKFATERKHLPVQDVASVGGWKDLDTLLQVYQQPDEATQRRVLSEPRRI
jgi:integrase